MKFVKCVNPKKSRSWSDGSPMRFTDVGNNTGIGKIEDAGKIREIEAMIADNRGGIFFIEETEFEALKKNQNSSPPSPGPWRQEISRRGIEVNRLPLGQGPSTIPEAAVAATEARPAAPQAAMAPAAEPPRPKATKRT